MILDSFLDELNKLAEGGHLALHQLVTPRRRQSLNSIGQILRRTVAKQASDLSALHDEKSPPTQEVNPVDASTRLPDSARTPSAIEAGALGAVTPSIDPIDRERFNRAWNSPPR